MKKLILLALLGLAGCSQFVHYTPVEYSGDPLATVERTLREQPGAYAPVSLEINRDRFTAKHNRQTPVTIYFNSVGEVRMFKKGREYRMRVIDRSGAGRMWVVTRNEDQARRFVDAITQLSTPRHPGSTKHAGD